MRKIRNDPIGVVFELQVGKMGRKNLFWIVLLGVLITHMVTLSVPQKNQKIVKVQKEEKRIRLIFKDRNQKTKQIVNTEQKNKKKPLDAKFLGKSDQSFDRQVVAKNIGQFKKASRGQVDGAKTKHKIAKKKKVKRSKKLSLKDLSLAALNPNNFVAPKGVKRGLAKKPSLAQNNDFVEDLPLGDFTNLNTKEFKYYGFFYRIRQQLEQHWGANLKNTIEGLYKRGQRIPASKNKITSLRITLDHRGHIVKIKVLGASGIRELDEAAIQSFNKAGPFPNPPKGMLKEGHAQLEWGFVVKG